MKKLALIGISGRADPPSPPLTLPVHSITQTYIRAVRKAGGLPVILPPLLEEGEAEPLLARLDGLLLSGGWDIDPQWYGEEQSSLVQGVDVARDRMEFAVLRAALRSGMPILAICRGLQVLNVALGGSLYQDIPSQVEPAILHRPEEGASPTSSLHEVQLVPGSRLASLLGGPAVRTNSFHHQAARELGEELDVTARTSDGLVEGLTHRSHPFCIGVQWHPEYPVQGQTCMDPLFDAFVEAAAQHT